mmetsp:Transcript_89151/g.109093  ORF Transcript_89151/g.109093 Transcript_89151/m.109093 type:complete len:221 (+) Transcript_89151:56-718(+)
MGPSHPTLHAQPLPATAIRSLAGPGFAGALLMKHRVASSLASCLAHHGLSRGITWMTSAAVKLCWEVATFLHQLFSCLRVCFLHYLGVFPLLRQQLHGILRDAVLLPQLLSLLQCHPLLHFLLFLSGKVFYRNLLAQRWRSLLASAKDQVFPSLLQQFFVALGAVQELQDLVQKVHATTTLHDVAPEVGQFISRSKRWLQHLLSQGIHLTLEVIITQILK